MAMKETIEEINRFRELEPWIQASVYQALKQQVYALHLISWMLQR